MQTMDLRIIDQDRENIYVADIEKIKIVGVSEIQAVNLLMETEAEDVLLGTFDTIADAIKELNDITTFQANFYPVSGYSNGGFARW